MKKLYLIRYTYQFKPEEVTHYEDNYYLCRNLPQALNDIQSKFNDDVEVKITQYEEIFYREV